MSDEILYRYVKGKGWIPEPQTRPTILISSSDNQIYESYNDIVHHRNRVPQRVTLINCPPLVGQYGWAVDYAVNEADGTLDYPTIFRDVTRVRYRDDYGWVCSEHSLNSESRYVTVVTELA